MTESHRPGLNHQTFLVSQAGGWKAPVKVSAGLVASEAWPPARGLTHVITMTPTAQGLRPDAYRALWRRRVPGPGGPSVGKWLSRACPVPSTTGKGRRAPFSGPVHAQGPAAAAQLSRGQGKVAERRTSQLGKSRHRGATRGTHGHTTARGWRPSPGAAEDEEVTH